jgi:hypothetical protein
MWSFKNDHREEDHRIKTSCERWLRIAKKSFHPSLAFPVAVPARALELLPSILQALSAVILTVGLSINDPSNGTSAKFLKGRR